MAPEVASGRGPTAAAHPPSPPPSPPQSVATIASNFRASKAFAERTALSVRVRSANAGKIPIIVEVDKRAHEEGPNTLTSLPVVKYLVSARAPGSSLREAILADAKLPTADTPLRIYLCSTGEELDYVTTLGDTDSVHRDPDGMLYVVVALFTAVPSPRTPTVPSAAVRPVATKGVVPAAIVQEVAGGSSGGVASSVSPAVGASDEPRGAKPVAYIQSLLDAPLPPQPPVGGMTNPHGELAPEGATIASCTFLNPRASGRLLPPAVPTGNGRVPASLYVATLLDVTAVGLVVPLLAAYSRHLGAGPRFTGVLQATYGLAQLIGANVFGGLSDTLGRRTLLLVSSAGGAVGYACLAAAVGPYASLPLLLASRLPIGLLKQSLTVSRALVADTTHVATRLRPMSRLGGCVAMGFVLGPGLGGVLSKKAGLTVPPMLATILFLLSNLVTFFFVPETAPLPLSMSELSALMAAAERAWREAVAEKELAAGRAIGLLMNSSGSTVTMLRPPPGLPVHGHPKPPVSVPIGPCASAATLDTPMANLVCARLIDTWRPNGRPIPPSETAPLLRRWHETLAKHAAAAKASTAAADPGVGGAVPPPPVAWATFRAALSEEYATYKVGMGMLHADASSALVLSAATAASTATPGSASASTSAAAAGGGGGGGGAFHGVLEILDSSRRLWKSKAMPQVRRLLFARAMVELSVMMLHATFADYTRAKYGWDQKHTGYGMAFSGALSVVVDMIILPSLHSRRLLAELPAGLLGGSLVAMGLLSLALAISSRGFFVGLTLLSFGISLFKSSLSTLVMGCARRDEAGTISGAMDMMEAVCRVTAPLVGGILLEHASLEGPPIAGSLLAIAGAAVLYEIAPAEHRATMRKHGFAPSADKKAV